MNVDNIEVFSYEGDQEFLVYCANKFIDTFKGKDTFLVPESKDGKLYSIDLPNTAIYSTKQELQYRLNRLFNTIYIEADIFSPLLLRKMPNSFWAIFAELDSIGKCSFSSCGSNEKIQNKNNKKKSNSSIFDLIKEIVLMDEHDSYCNDFGFLEVAFDLSEKRSNLIENIISALTLLHKINYLLYRKNYLNSRK